MSNVLTQEEIDALLTGIAQGRSDPLDSAAMREEAEVVPFTFNNQDRIARGGMPTLEVIHDRFARLLQTAMTQTLRRSVEVHVLDNVEQRFGEFARHLPRPVSLHVIKMAPLPGRGMLAISGELIYTLIEIVFGGAGRKGRKAEPRDFTLIEQRVIANLTATIDRKYAEAWRPVYSVQIETGASEANPQFINIAQPSDKVVAVEYEVQIDDARAPMSICIPYSAIDPIKETLKGSTIGEEGSDGGAWGRELRRKLGEAKVEMRAMLGSATIAVQDLINLKVGDVIQLDEDFEHPIRLLIESAPKAWARVGAHKSARAVQVTGFIRDERKT